MEETLQEKEAYERLAFTHGSRVCAYREDNGIFADTLLKEAVQTCGQKISYCGVGSHHQNTIVERKIKELTLGSQTLLLHSTRLCQEEVITMMWNFSFKAEYQSYNILEMYEERKMTEQKFSGVKLQNLPTDYHTWVRPVFVLEAPL